MSKDKLLAILREIEDGLSMVDAQLAIFELAKNDDVRELATSIREHLTTVSDISDLKELVEQL